MFIGFMEILIAISVLVIVSVTIWTFVSADKKRKRSGESTFTPISGHVVRCPVMKADALIIINGKTGTVEVRCPNMDVMREGYCTMLSTAMKERYCAYSIQGAKPKNIKKTHNRRLTLFQRLRKT